MTQYKDWKWESISKHIESYQSGIASGEKSRDTGYPHLRMNNISVRFTLNQDELWYIPASEEEKIKYSIKKGDLLFNNTNSAELVGKSCVFDINQDKVFLFSNHLTRIRTKGTLDSLYLLYWIQSLWEKGYFKDNCTKWVNQAAVRPEDVLFTKEIFLPPTIEEQQAFANEIRFKINHVEIMRKTVLKQKEAIEALPAAILRQTFNFENIEK
jgi:type I restriction enzyme, S subunit